MSDPVDVIFADARDGKLVHEPWEGYEELRQRSPIAWSDRARCFYVSRHADVQMILDRSDLTATHPFRGSRVAFGSTILDTEGPDHDRLHDIMSGALRGQRLSELDDEVVRPAIRQALRGLDFDDGVSADLTPVFEVIPLRVMCAMLGIPRADLSFVDAAIRPLVAVVDNGPTGVASVHAFRRSLHRYLDEVLFGCRSYPASATMTAALVEAVDAGVMTSDEAVRHAALLLVAGTATTASAMANTVWLWLGSPLTIDLHASAHRLGDVVRESLRLEPPLRFTPRFAAQDVQVGDVEATAGSMFQLCLASANRDGEAFPDPSTFSLDRRPRPSPVTFGRGAHACLGAALGQLEVKAFLEELQDAIGPCSARVSDELAPAPSFRRPREVRLCRGSVREGVR